MKKIICAFLCFSMVFMCFGDEWIIPNIDNNATFPLPLDFSITPNYNLPVDTGNLSFRSSGFDTQAYGWNNFDSGVVEYNSTNDQKMADTLVYAASIGGITLVVAGVIAIIYLLAR